MARIYEFGHSDIRNWFIMNLRETLLFLSYFLQIKSVLLTMLGIIIGIAGVIVIISAKQWRRV